MLISDYLNTIDKDDMLIYMGAGEEFDGTVRKSALVFSHELSMTGAPVVLQSFTEVLKKKGYTIFLLCHKDGPMRDSFANAGVNVIVYENYREDIKWLKTISNYFDMLIFNTLAFFNIIENLKTVNKKKIWWIHEQEENFKLISDELKNKEYGDNCKIFAVSPYAQKSIKKHMNLETEILNIYISDSKGCYKRNM